MRKDFSRRARALVGVRFRAQGRSAETGLDCVGLVLEVFGIPPDDVPRDYQLRGDHRTRIEQGLDRFFRRIREVEQHPGDVILLTPSIDQLHLGILTDAGFVHADARLGRVVETPGRPLWPMIGTYRSRSRPKKGG